MSENVIISGLHMDLTDALKSIVMEKTGKLFKHEESIIRLRIELESTTCSATRQNEFVAKGHVEMNGSPIVINEASNDLYKSIDRLIDKLDRGLRRRARLKLVKRKKTSLNDSIAMGTQPHLA